MKFSELLKINTELREKVKSFKPLKVSILSNIMISYLKNVLEYNLRLSGLNPVLKFGDYDNILQTSVELSQEESDLIIIFWEFANLVDGLQYKILNYGEEEYRQLLDRIKNELQMTLNNLSNKSIVVFNKFTATPFTMYNLNPNQLDNMVNELNVYLDEVKPSNTIIIDLDKIYAQLSVSESINMRDYYSSKTFYTPKFFEAYSEQILPIVLSSNGKVKKALIFDCDNTLWQGILGEDGFDKIKMSADLKATPYEEIQHMAKSMAKKGVIIGLNSKNNFEDVQVVLSSHKDIVLKDEDILIKKVNWNDKVNNLKEISTELNIGLDSFVFVDDSDFEVNLVRENLPEVKLIQVPFEAIHTYPELLRKELRVFFNRFETEEDKNKLNQYRSEQQRKQDSQKFENIEEYLKSLEIELKIGVNQQQDIARVSQMTQKTNQFNLTTQRYTEQDIQNLINDGSMVINMSVRDKFGSNGVTGLAIVKFKSKVAQLDTLLMSCRILGRNIEYKFIDHVLSEVMDRGIERIEASYIKTNKNAQVADFYKKVGFVEISEDGLTKQYELDPNKYQHRNIDYIKLIL